MYSTPDQEDRTYVIRLLSDEPCRIPSPENWHWCSCGVASAESMICTHTRACSSEAMLLL
jgi:hypothetical protein